MRTRARRAGAGITGMLGVLGWSAAAAAQPGLGFVNWETPHVHPLDLTPDRTRLLAVNTADNRLEVYDVATGLPAPVGAVPVGLDPVSVRARTNTEAWVVNHVSDTVSVVDLNTMNVTMTLRTGDEPADVVFAAGKAFVSVSQLNHVKVFDLANLAAPPLVVPIEGEDPRALATDGTRVYAAIFESGNQTTILGQPVVSSAANPYPGDQNPPPNAGAGFDPPLAPGLPPAPDVGLIVKRAPDGTWRDDNGGNWSSSVGWSLHDHDVAIIDAATLGVTYATGLMNLNMALGVRPDGQVTVVGTEALNQVRFEPVLNGRFLRVLMARFDPAAPAGVITTDLNPHLEPYAGSSVPQAVRDQSLGDPRAIVWNGAGTAGYVAGMGSNTVVRIDAAGARLGQIEAGEGPTGLALDETRGRLYVLDKFAGRVTVVETAGHSVIAARNFFDPTPQVIRLGRPHLYDTRRTSGLGHVSCASCHIDARMDQLAWDLGNPAGAVQPFDQNCNFGVGGCENWHPMKGPMVTQSLQGLPGTGPLHWRADRANLAAFNGAFVGLLGDDVMLTPQEMAQFNSFLATIIYPPNPFRTITNALPTTPINGGNAVTGDQLYRNAPIDGGFLTCNACHALPTGTNGTVTSANLLGETQSMKIPQLRNMYEKTGLDLIPGSVNNRGFGYIHDGSSPNLVAFLQAPVFNFPPGPTGMQQRRDIAAFVFAMSVDTHAGVGTQNTVATGSLSLLPPDQQARLNTMVSLAQGGSAGLVAKGRVAGRGRGYVYDQAASGFRSDRTGEPVLSLIQLAALTGPGSELTFTTVPIGTQRRIGIDRDADTWLDGDERAVCADPADPAVFPGSPRSVDRNADLLVGTSDVSVFLTSWFADLSTGTFTSDFDASGTVSTADITAFLGAWFAALAGGC